MNRPLTALLATTIFAILAASCGSDSEPKLTLADQQGDSEPMQFAKQHFREVCVSCHGLRGRGDGIVGKNLEPRPRSFGEQSWQDGVSDAHITKVIIEGGPSVGLTPLMAPNTVPRVEDDPEVLAALIEIIRSFGR